MLEMFSILLSNFLEVNSNQVLLYSTIDQNHIICKMKTAEIHAF